ncbi:MAG: hypothetical protein ACOYOU_17965 [Kiritimatiellia bacterium]
MKEKASSPAVPGSGPAAGDNTGAMSRPVDKYDAPGLMAKPGGSQFHVMICGIAGASVRRTG